MKSKKEKVFALARGYFGRRKNCWTVAVRAVQKSLQKAYIGRKQKKRNIRSVWIQQINAGARQHGVTYAQLIKWMPMTGMDLNRKTLASLAGTEPYTFKAVVEAVRTVSASAKAAAAAATAAAANKGAAGVGTAAQQMR